MMEGHPVRKAVTIIAGVSSPVTALNACRP
jgi:hypothetical protein